MLADFYKDTNSVFHELATTGDIGDKCIPLGDVDMTIIRAEEAEVEDPARQCHANDKLELYQKLTGVPINSIIKTPGNHWTMLFNPHVKAVSEIMIKSKY